ncbi:MAG TPA: hypothetical protein VFT56_07325 [Sphingomonas sp.]|nr:hypothetical protein [Sphingomonas sp.]
MSDRAHSNARAVTRALVVTVAGVALAVLAWLSAADRMTAASPVRNAAYFGGDTAARTAFGALARNDPQNALAEAQRAVSGAPVDPSTTSALASAALALGRTDQAYAAFTVAGALGWRDVPTQLFWLTQGSAIGDRDVVTQRLDALLRLDVDDESVANSLLLLEKTQLGQTALVTLLAQDPPWKRRFVLNTGGLGGADLAARLATIEMAAQKGATFDCDAVGAAANRLIHNDEAGLGRDLWRRACDRAGDLYLSNGSFGRDSAPSSNPFDWQLLSRGGLDVNIAPAPAPLHGQALRVASSQTARTVAARQLATLAPGRYRLSWTTALDTGKPDGSLRALVRCDGLGELTSAEPPPGQGQSNRAASSFTVPESGCAVQVVEVQTAASAPGETRTGWIDDIRIVPLASTAAAAGG